MIKNKIIFFGLFTLILPIKYRSLLFFREEDKSSSHDFPPEAIQLKTKAINKGLDLENWMSQLPHHLTAAPIIYIAIPGIYIF